MSSGESREIVEPLQGQIGDVSHQATETGGKGVRLHGGQTCADGRVSVKGGDAQR